MELHAFRMVLVSVLLPLCLSAPKQADLTWTCGQTPQLCLPSSSKDQCGVDTDCPTGSRCCYRGCVKRCMEPRPCDSVICEEGFICVTEETECSSPPCQKQAACVPENKVRCPQLMCPTDQCSPGYERGTTADGCPTCDCVPMKQCGPTCTIYCSYGNVLDEEGCPTCSCKPEPENPCSGMQCPSGQECRFVQTQCLVAPCDSVATCVDKIMPLYENSCSMRDRTTLGLPVLLSDRKSELDCYLDRCPRSTICAKMGKDINRCCWQQTQKEVVAPPKVGECPVEYMIDHENLDLTPCEVDAQCPDQQKCCYKRPEPGTVRTYGFCMGTINDVITNATSLCERMPFLRFMFSLYDLC